MKHCTILLLLNFCLIQFAKAQTNIKDTDGNTNVQTEANPNDDVVRINTNGLLRLAAFGNASGITNITVGNSNQGVLIGNGAGLNLLPAGIQNVAIGHQTGMQLTTATDNVLIGAFSGKQITSGTFNIGIGTSTMANATIASSNIGIGHLALSNLTVGSSNTAIGRNALLANTFGNFNVAVGLGAGDGSPANIDCSYLGTDADNTISGANLTNSTALGFSARLTASNQVRIGNSSVTSIGGFANWSNVSDARVKTGVKENVPGLDFIMQLRPVTYHLDLSIINRMLHREPSAEEMASIREKEKSLYTGFLAQEVEQAAQKLQYEFSGVDAPKNEQDLYGLRYAEFVAPLVKAVQEQQIEIQAQRAEIDALKALVGQLTSGRSKTTATQMKIWPNPAGQSAQVDITGVTEGAMLSLYAADGRLLIVQRAREGAQSISLDHLPAGAMMLQLSLPGAEPVTNILVKQ